MQFPTGTNCHIGDPFPFASAPGAQSCQSPTRRRSTDGLVWKGSFRHERVSARVGEGLGHGAGRAVDHQVRRAAAEGRAADGEHAGRNVDVREVRAVRERPRADLLAALRDHDDDRGAAREGLLVDLDEAGGQGEDGHDRDRAGGRIAAVHRGDGDRRRAGGPGRDNAAVADRGDAGVAARPSDRFVRGVARRDRRGEGQRVARLEARAGVVQSHARDGGTHRDHAGVGIAAVSRRGGDGRRAVGNGRDDAAAADRGDAGVAARPSDRLVRGVARGDSGGEGIGTALLHLQFRFIQINLANVNRRRI